MMTLEFKHQESYSRGELLLRSFFGWAYIIIPHMFVLMFISLWGSILNFLAWWTILFTGRYPQSWFEYQVKQMRWNLRVTARIYHMADGYPKFGLDAEDDNVTFDVEYPEKLSRGTLLLRSFFGWLYVLIPHGFILVFFAYAALFVLGLNWWIILFTGKIPSGMFNFVMKYIRWAYRVQIYMMFMTDTYPPFNGDPDPVPVAAPSSDSGNGGDGGGDSNGGGSDESAS